MGSRRELRRGRKATAAAAATSSCAFGRDDGGTANGAIDMGAEASVDAAEMKGMAALGNEAEKLAIAELGKANVAIGRAVVEDPISGLVRPGCYRPYGGFIETSGSSLPDVMIHHITSAVSGGGQGGSRVVEEVTTAAEPDEKEKSKEEATGEEGGGGNGEGGDKVAALVDVDGDRAGAEVVSGSYDKESIGGVGAGQRS